MKKPLFMIMTIFIMIVIVEVTMRLLGVMLTPETEKVEFKKDTVRILALGESTTEAHMMNEKDISWPGIIEAEFLKEGRNIKIYNKALSATTSLMILASIDDYLEKYKPHYVISMLGINDNWLLRDTKLRYEENILFKIKYNLKRLRIVKLFTWMLVLAENSKNTLTGYEIDEELIKKIILKNKEELAVFVNAKMSVKEMKIAFKNLVQVWQYTTLREKSPLTAEELSEQGIVIGLRLRERGVTDSFLYGQLIEFIHGENSFKLCTKIFEEAFEAKFKLRDDVVAFGLRCIAKTSRENEKFLSHYNSIIGDSHYYENYIAHYRLLFDKLEKRNTKLIAVQYANFPASTLKYVFSKNFSDSKSTEIDVLSENKGGKIYDIDAKYNGVLIVDSESFLKENKMHIYDDLFSDELFGGTGHFTVLGHELFGKNIHKKIRAFVE